MTEKFPSHEQEACLSDGTRIQYVDTITTNDWYREFFNGCMKEGATLMKKLEQEPRPEASF